MKAKQRREGIRFMFFTGTREAVRKEKVIKPVAVPIFKI